MMKILSNNSIDCINNYLQNLSSANQTNKNNYFQNRIISLMKKAYNNVKEQLLTLE